MGKKGKSPPKAKPQPKQEGNPEDNPGFGLFDDPAFVITGVGQAPQNPHQNVPGDNEEEIEDAEGAEEKNEDNLDDPNNEVNSSDDDDSNDDDSDSDADVLHAILELLKRKKKKKSATPKKKPKTELHFLTSLCHHLRRKPQNLQSRPSITWVSSSTLERRTTKAPTRLH